MIYEPAEDSFLLQKAVRKYSRNKRVLDMGSGSGIQAKTALAAGAFEVTAVDIDPDAISLLKKQNLKAIKSNLFQNVTGKFDIIVFNPPYLPEDKREDAESSRITTGGKEGDEIIIKFLKQSPKHLSPGGSILILLSSLTPQTKINALLKKQRLSKRIIDKTSVFMETLEVWKLNRVQ